MPDSDNLVLGRGIIGKKSRAKKKTASALSLKGEEGRASGKSYLVVKLA